MTTNDRSTEMPDLDDGEVQALHEVELGVEWLERAQGALLEFHHNTGHAMEHLTAAESLFRERGHSEVADAIRDRYLPRGVIDGDRWSYDVVESFESELLAEMRAFEREVREDIADGRRHVAERRQERTWKRRSRE